MRYILNRKQDLAKGMPISILQDLKQHRLGRLGNKNTMLAWARHGPELSRGEMGYILSTKQGLIPVWHFNNIQGLKQYRLGMPGNKTQC